MRDASDLRRRIDAALRSKSLHPNYARELLREASEALLPQIVECDAVPPGEAWLLQNGLPAGRIVNISLDP